MQSTAPAQRDDSHPVPLFFGPWNISTGADPFGPPVRKEMEFARKLKAYKELASTPFSFTTTTSCRPISTGRAPRRGSPRSRRCSTAKGCSSRSSRLGSGKTPARSTARSRPTTPATASTPSIAPGGASTSPARSAARTTCSGWPVKARTSARPSAPRPPIARIVDAWNAILEHDKEIRVLGEAKPNEPMDQAYLPTVGHMVGVAYKTIDPGRSGVLIESAHSILAGLDPADDMAYALYHNKLWSVHLNDQNGLKYDQDKVFGSVDLRRAFNQIWVLEKNGYGRNGECVGLDVKAMRTTTFEESMYHLSHSKTMFLRLLDVVRGVDETQGRRAASPSQVRAAGDADLECPSGAEGLIRSIRACLSASAAPAAR